MRKTLAIVGAIFVATATVALAGSVDQGRRLAGPFCINGQTGVVRSVALLNTGKCKPGEIRRVGIAVPVVPAVPGPAGAQGVAGKDGATGATGATGAVGPQGVAGAKGDAGDSYLTGAYYAVAHYDVGDTNAGAIATVACASESDTAISGGVSVDDYTKNVPVGQSFPGRMNWETNTPKADRLDGWIVQFAGNFEVNPEKVKVWALCVPNLTIPVVTTYTQSS